VRYCRTMSPRSTVAANLGMAVRTLARRLSEEGTGYGAVLALSQIAWLLGYSEVTSLNHAFERWTGHSPKRAHAG
jgi:AraC-like DNA-binding protein